MWLVYRPAAGRLYHDEAQNDSTPWLCSRASSSSISQPTTVASQSSLAVRPPAQPICDQTASAFVGIPRWQQPSTWVGRQTAAGRWALAVLAVTLWHIHLSRPLPLGAAAILHGALPRLQKARALRSGTALRLAAGVPRCKLEHYRQRFTPIAGGPRTHGLLCYPQKMRLHWRGKVLAALAALIVLLPLGLIRSGLLRCSGSQRSSVGLQ